MGRKKNSGNYTDGKKIEKLRKDKGFKSMLQFSTATDVCISQIFYIEKTNANAYISTLMKIANELNVSVSELIHPDQWAKPSC